MPQIPYCDVCASIGADVKPDGTVTPLAGWSALPVLAILPVPNGQPQNPFNQAPRTKTITVNVCPACEGKMSVADYIALVKKQVAAAQTTP
jgi:hypothetical protein